MDYKIILKSFDLKKRKTRSIKKLIWKGKNYDKKRENEKENDTSKNGKT